MGHKHGEDFKREAVRLALSSGLTRKQVAADLGIGLSTLGKWIATYRTEERPDLPSADLLKEVEQLRRENRTLKEERDILKKATAFFASQK
jgi:transposase